MNKRKQPVINTSSLPDIVFMLLFFFMTITVIRSHENKVEVHLPQVERLTKLDYNKTYGHLYLGESTVLQLNDKFLKLEEVEPGIRRLSGSDGPYKTKLYIDQHKKMREVNKVKLEIRKSEALKIEYVLNEEF